MTPGIDQRVQDPAGSSVAAVVIAVVAAERAACDVLGVEVSVEAGPDVMAQTELGTEQKCGEEAARSE